MVWTRRNVGSSSSRLSEVAVITSTTTSGIRLDLWRTLAVLTVRCATPCYSKKDISCLTHISAFVVPVLLASTVAVTRAKALLIIVGDPLVLGLDPLWREYLNTVHAGGGWRGRPIPWDPVEPVDPEGGYDVDLRIRALDTADALAERLLDGDDEDGGPGEDQPYHETEE
jgi:hypothetical protein